MQLDIMEENQHRLYIACETCEGNFVTTIFDFFFETVQRNEFVYFYRNDFPIFGALTGGAFRTMTQCVHRRYIWKRVNVNTKKAGLFEVGFSGREPPSHPLHI